MKVFLLSPKMTQILHPKDTPHLYVFSSFNYLKYMYELSGKSLIQNLVLFGGLKPLSVLFCRHEHLHDVFQTRQ